MCDAIIAVWFKEGFYLFIIEQKTAHTGDYQKQLANGRHFCNWPISLYEEHGYLPVNPVYISLLIYQPRQRTVDKGTTTRCGNGIDRAKTTIEGFDASFAAKNRTDIRLGEMLEDILKQGK